MVPPRRLLPIAATAPVVLSLALGRAAAHFAGDFGTLRGTAPRRREADQLRFGQADALVDQALATVVLGFITLTAQIPADLVDDMCVPLQEALAATVSVQDYFVITEVVAPANNATSTATLQDYQYKYYILPVGINADDAKKDIVASSAGGVMSSFIMSLFLQMALYTPTARLSHNAWKAAFTAPATDMRMVLRPKDVVWITSTKRATAQTTTSAQATSVCWAADRACSCAALPGCTWVLDSSNVATCTSADPGTVSCRYCAAQASCPDAQCSLVSTPCDCVSSPLGCRWDASVPRCMTRGTGSTPCTACARQSQCKPPLAIAFSPASGSTLTAAQSLTVKITFSTTVSLGASPSVTLLCSGLSRPTAVPLSDLQTIGMQLLVSVDSVAGSVSGARECELDIGEGTVTDTLGVPFLGLSGSSAYIFKLEDAVVPFITSVQPQNGGSGVAAGVVTFTFNEQIFLGPDSDSMVASLHTLDSATDSTTKPIPFVAPHVKVDAVRLLVDVSDLSLQSGVLYSLVLPPGSVVDSAGNAFDGLPLRMYVFRVGATATAGPTGQSAPASSANTLALVVSAVAVLVGTALCCFLVWRVYRRRPSKVRPAPPPSVIPVRPARSGSQMSWKEGPGPRHAGWATEDAPEVQDLNSTGGSGAFEASFRSSRTAAFNSSPGPPSRTSSMGATKSEGWAASSPQPRWKEALRGHGTPEASRATTPGPSSPKTASHGGGRFGTFAKAGAHAAGSPRAGAPNKPKSPPSPGAPRPTGSPQPAASPPGTAEPGRRRAASPEGPGAGAREEPRTFVASAAEVPGEDPEVRKKKLELERRLREAMSRPVAEKKKVLRELMLEFHPDKNNDPHAKDIFQFVNASRGWFLTET